MSSMKIKHRKVAACEVAVEDDDGVHGGRMKPLSSLGVNSAKNRLLAASDPSSQVHTLTRQRTKAMCNTSSLKDGKRHASIRMRSRNRRSKSFTYKRLHAIDRKVAAFPHQIKETSHCNDRNAHLKSKNAKDREGASHVICKGLETTSQVRENIDSGFKEEAIPKKHPKLAARQAIELPSGMNQDNIDNAKTRKSPPSDAKSHRETNNPTFNAANDVAKQCSETAPYRRTVALLQPAEEVFADIKTEKWEVDVITVEGLDSDCEHMTLTYANHSGSSSSDSAQLGKTMMKQGPASKFSYSMDSKMMWTQFYRDRALDISNLGLTSLHHDPKETETVKQMKVLNLGIINRPRDKKQVHEALAALIGAPSTITSSPERLQAQAGNNVEIHKDRPAKRSRMTPLDLEDMPRLNCFSSPDFVTTVNLMDVTTQDDPHKVDQVLGQNLHNGVCPSATTDSMIVSNCFLQGLERKAEGVNLSKLGNPVAKPDKQSRSGWTCDQTVSGRSANLAACWLNLLRLDVKGRLSALKRSRRRIQNVVVSGWHQDKVSYQEDLFKTGMGCNVGAGSKGGSEVTGWRAFFLNMDAVLHSEGTKLDDCLQQIRNIQFHCRKTSSWSPLLLNHEVGCMDAELEEDCVPACKALSPELEL